MGVSDDAHVETLLEKIAREKIERTAANDRALNSSTTDWDAEPTLLQQLRMMHKMQVSLSLNLKP